LGPRWLAYTWLAFTVVPSSTTLSSIRLFGPITQPAPILVAPRRIVPGRMAAPGAISTLSSIKISRLVMLTPFAM